jgi:hypothetical protein
MVYSKPEIVFLGAACDSIQGHKLVGLEPCPPLFNPNRVADSELDD